MNKPDRLILELDRAVRTVFGAAHATRPAPNAAVPEAPLSKEERREAAALMRVNHCGEVCAQALYRGQSLASRDAQTRSALASAAQEEEDHLAWSATRVAELGGHLSLLNPLWYGASLALGYTAGRFGDKWNLGFLRETELQVEAHLDRHLERLAPRDVRTRVLVAQMKAEEAGHADKAAALGAAELPAPLKLGMRAASRVMTTFSHWL
jgi:ubiquinone biosynthesis monooxygenase Coq7